MAKTGRKSKGPFGNEEIAAFLAALRKGHGVAMALVEMKTNYRRYRRTLKEVKGFRREVKTAIAYRRERLVSLRYDAAIQGDARAQEFLIARDDRARQFEREMRLRRAELAKQDELAGRLESLQGDQGMGRPGRRPRAQPPQRD